MFPSVRTLRPLVIVDRSALAGRTVGIGDELWAKGSSDTVVKDLIDAGIGTAWC